MEGKAAVPFVPNGCWLESLWGFFFQVKAPDLQFKSETSSKQISKNKMFYGTAVKVLPDGFQLHQTEPEWLLPSSANMSYGPKTSIQADQQMNTSKYLKHLKEWGETNSFVHTTSCCVNVCEVSQYLFIFHMFLASNLSRIFCAVLTVQISKRSVQSRCSCKTLGICEMWTFRNI